MRTPRQLYTRGMCAGGLAALGVVIFGADRNLGVHGVRLWGLPLVIAFVLTVDQIWLARMERGKP